VKVLVLTNMYPSEAEPWAGCFVKDQVEDLQALGVDVRVVAFDGRSDSTAYPRVVRTLRRALREDSADLIHAHYGLTGAVALTQRRAPVVVTFHGSDTGYVRWQGMMSWFVARASAAIFVNVEAARRLGRPNAPVICAPVDTELFVPGPRVEARRALGWRETARYVLLPGARASPVKRADLFDAAVRHAQGLVPALRPVSLEGFSRAESALVMNAVDVTLMTSDDEGSPVAIKESLACMTPVVSVPVGDVPSLVAGLPGCAIACREPPALAQRLLEALHAGRDPELRERAQRFSRPRIAERTLALYECVTRGLRG
jgi:glycosyltransferase involved in cell wall biosynthesis